MTLRHKAHRRVDVAPLAPPAGGDPARSSSPFPSRQLVGRSDPADGAAKTDKIVPACRLCSQHRRSRPRPPKCVHRKTCSFHVAARGQHEAGPSRQRVKRQIGRAPVENAPPGTTDSRGREGSRIRPGTARPRPRCAPGPGRRRGPTGRPRSVDPFQRGSTHERSRRPRRTRVCHWWFPFLPTGRPNDAMPMAQRLIRSALFLPPAPPGTADTQTPGSGASR